ncbi:hypothetical protein ACWEQ1_00695 [Streptomyces nodosus]
MRRSAIRLGRKLARYSEPLFVFMAAGSTGFVLVAAYQLANLQGPSH